MVFEVNVLEEIMRSSSFVPASVFLTRAGHKKILALNVI